MDNLTKHAALLPRRHPSLTPLQTVGFIPRKTVCTKETFRIYAFSFILKGEGTFRYNGVNYAVQAPMVITQWPGAYLEYGPSEKSIFWEEVYFVYDAETIPALERLGFIQPGRFFWKIYSIDKITDQLRRIYELCRSEGKSLMGDWFDRLAEQAILTSHEQPLLKSESESDRRLEAIEKEVRKFFKSSISFEDLAQKHGFSYTHFRRLWAKRKGLSPGRFQSELQIHEACRLLVETSLRVAEIADRVGWEDPLYFSRKFKNLMKRSPQDYREAYKISR